MQLLEVVAGVGHVTDQIFPLGPKNFSCDAYGQCLEGSITLSPRKKGGDRWSVCRVTQEPTYLQACPKFQCQNSSTILAFAPRLEIFAWVPLDLEKHSMFFDC